MGPGIKQAYSSRVSSFSMFTGNSVATSSFCVIRHCFQRCKNGMSANIAPGKLLKI